MTMPTPINVENSGPPMSSYQPIYAHFTAKIADIHCAAADLALFRKPEIRAQYRPHTGVDMEKIRKLESRQEQEAGRLGKYIHQR
jgi:hypothetical protein